MGAATLDQLAALGEELAGLARMRETVDAMGRSLTTLERTTAELRQDVTRLGERVEWIGTRGPDKWFKSGVSSHCAREWFTGTWPSKLGVKRSHKSEL